MEELDWVYEARKNIGVSEIPGKAENPTIQKWLRSLKAWWNSESVPWCGTFAAWCLRAGNRSIPKHWYRALAYADYGTKLKAPAYGCLAVMQRKGGGHVGFVVGQTSNNGDLLILGGNQGDKVSIARFPRHRITAYVWPNKGDGTKSVPNTARYNLPIGTAAYSTRED